MRCTKDLIDYQYRMCLYGRPEHILAYQITVIGNECDYRVTETELKPVCTHDVTLSEEEVRLLLLALAGVIGDCREYLLDFDGVMLKDEGIFRRKTGTVGFLYQPFRRELDKNHRRKTEEWFAGLYQHVDMENETVMTMLHPLSIALADERFTLDDFETLIYKTVEG